MKHFARRSTAYICIAVGGFSLAACGNDSTTTVVKTVATPTTGIPVPTTPTTPASPADPGALNPNTNLALLRGQVFIAKYCVKVLGSRLGRNSPPSANDTKLKNNAVFSLVYTVKRQADAKTSTGKTVRDLAYKGAESLRNGDCDPANAKKLENAAIDAP